MVVAPVTRTRTMPMEDVTGLPTPDLLPVSAVIFLASCVHHLRRWDSIHNPLWTSPPVKLLNSTPNHAAVEKPACDPCRTCSGNGQVRCSVCSGAGRSNCTDQLVLPKGVFPIWCKNCRAKGLELCPRCFGTGRRAPSIGFRLPNQ
jgi:hypothetical protein